MRRMPASSAIIGACGRMSQMRDCAHVLLACGLLACSSGAQDKGATPASPDVTAVDPGGFAPLDAGLVRSTAPRFAYTTLDEPSVMAALGAGGANFDDLVSPAWLADIETTLARQINAIARADSHAGVGIRGNTHRLFNKRWLRDGHFELIGLTYRSERIPVDTGRCGDVRLVYRLAYQTEISGERVHSRLPMTLLVELAAAESGATGCKPEAMRWSSETELAGQALASHLLGGALQGRLTPEHVTQVLLNAQIVRWPSSVRPDLGGHAEYSMLAFEPGDDRRTLRVKTLENMPSVAKIANNAEMRAALVDWVGANLAAIDEGSAILPEVFLANEATSVTPRGLSRLANRPFRQLFDSEEFASLKLDAFARISSPEALLRRLDDLSCVGCHQSRTIAGFHWLGVDNSEVAVGNGLFVSRSVPLQGDARRRAEQTLVLASGETPSFSRPFAERDDIDLGGIGARCGLGDPGFASWTCADGLVCDPYDSPTSDAVIGVCSSPALAALGESCQVAPLSQNANPHRDRARGATTRACETGVCNVNRTGFPGGMCTSGCGDLPDDGTCGVIALLTPFNNCLARKTPFPKCLAEHVTPAGLRRCDAAHPCRDDYVCAQTPSGEGGCMPPYFLFQLRVDGHP